MYQIRMMALEGMPLIETGNDLGAIIIRNLEQHQMQLENHDVLVVTSKIVSKAEGRWVDLRKVEPDERAIHIATQINKDPREVALVLQETRRISRQGSHVLIVENRLGIVCANAGIDFSNARNEAHWALLLPENPDQSAGALRNQLGQHYGVELAVIISDSMGRPFRYGTVGIAIGAAGIKTLVDERQKPDLFNRPMQITTVGRADEIAAAAGILSGQTNEGRPVVLVRGLDYQVDNGATAHDLQRDPDEDLYR